ncbi:MAG: TrkA C-terminal domain-containing protein [Akkermansiaceae bacterium]
MGSGSLLALLIIVIVSLLIVRIGTNALILTGMSLHASRFQAASAFFGVGFTTSEAEMVVNHSVRRKIVLHLIILGNIGLTSALATLIVTFVNNNEGSHVIFGKLGLMAAGVTCLYILSHTGFIKRPLDAVMKFSLERAGVVRAQDYGLLLNVEDGFCISDFRVDDGHVLAGKALYESRPNDHDIVILGIRRVDGKFVGAPGKDDVIHAGDTIMVYGSEDSVDKMADSSQEERDDD